jgi:hypothetical protein
MQHHVRFHYRPKGHAPALEYDRGIDLTPDDGPVLLPAIGDHVEVQGHGIDCVVDARKFTYLTIGGQTQCLITIILTDSDVDSGELANPPVYFRTGSDEDIR